MSGFGITIIVAASLLTITLILFYYQRFEFAFTLLILSTWHAAFTITAAIGKTFDTVIFGVALISTIVSVFGLMVTNKIEQTAKDQYESVFERYKEERELINKRRREKIINVIMKKLKRNKT